VTVGRPLPAYRDMFLPDDDDLAAGPILDGPGGASPFGVQVRRLGGEVVSVDPAYAGARLPHRARADLDRIVAWPRACCWCAAARPERDSVASEQVVGDVPEMRPHGLTRLAGIAVA
jgi:hypothetical protein